MTVPSTMNQATRSTRPTRVTTPAHDRVRRTERPARAGWVRLPAVTLALLLLAPGISAGAGKGEAAAETFIRDGINRILTILKQRQVSGDVKLERLRNEFRKNFDHRLIGGFAAGRHFRVASADARQRYLGALENYVVTVYGRRMIHYSTQMDLKLKADDLIKITGASKVGRRDVIVHSHINRRLLEPVTINWRLRRRSAGYRIIDIIVVGISQAQLYRSEFTSVIRRRGKGLEGLTEALISKRVALVKGN